MKPVLPREGADGAGGASTCPRTACPESSRQQSGGSGSLSRTHMQAEVRVQLPCGDQRGPAPLRTGFTREAVRPAPRNTCCTRAPANWGRRTGLKPSRRQAGAHPTSIRRRGNRSRHVALEHEGPRLRAPGITGASPRVRCSRRPAAKIKGISRHLRATLFSLGPPQGHRTPRRGLRSQDLGTARGRRGGQDPMHHSSVLIQVFIESSGGAPRRATQTNTVTPGCTGEGGGSVLFTNRALRPTRAYEET